jgi:hypothetical protein
MVYNMRKGLLHQGLLIRLKSHELIWWAQLKPTRRWRMGNKDTDTHDGLTFDAEEGGSEKTLPLIALGLEILPALLLLAYPFIRMGLPFIMLMVIALPIIGFIMGIQCLCLMRKQSSSTGKTIAVALAIVTVALPPAAVLFVVLSVIGAVTNGLAHM